MRISFLVGSVEPGKDGVGDYTRRLATTFRSSGDDTQIIALQDPWAPQPPETPSPDLRLSPSLDWSQRITAADSALRDFKPDWVSLQFVAYSYDPKGFCAKITPGLLRLLKGHRVQVMLHELWIGFWARATWTDRWIGWRQRRQILHLLRALKPAALATSIPRYRELLRTHQLGCAQLPLFGNFPPVGARDWIKPQLEQLGIARAERAQWILLGVMGTVHARWPKPTWLKTMVREAEQRGKRVALLGIGRPTPAGRQRLEETAQEVGPPLCFHHFGQQPEQHIAQFLGEVDLGVSTVERSMLGKSGAVAAMREHGLPVMVPRMDDGHDFPATHRQLEAEIRVFLDGNVPSAWQQPAVSPDEVRKAMITEFCQSAQSTSV